MNFKYVIIGGSAGGIGAVEAIRENDKAGSLAVISEEPTPQYSRPMISEYLGDGVKLEEIVYRSLQFWEEHAVNILAGRRVVKLDASMKEIILDDGIEIGFEKLLIATGGKPIIPKIEGTDNIEIYTFTTLADAKLLLEKLPNAEHIVVVGGGLIGVSLAEALAKLRKKVTIIELKDRILSLILDADGSALVAEAIERAGVRMITGHSATRILGKDYSDSEVREVVLDDGTELACDLVVFAVGVSPRIEMIDLAYIKVNRGIVVDRFMATSAPDIYACGDVAEAHDFTCGDSRALPLWPLAYIGGRVAGSNMAGLKAEYPGGTQMNALNYFGLPVITVGIVNPPVDSGFEVLTNLRRESRTYRKIVLQNGIITGMILVGKIDGAGIIFDLLKNKVNVKEFKNNILSEDFGLLHLSEPLRRDLLGRN